MVNMKEIGTNLKNFRLERGFSVYDVEKMTGIMHQNIYRWERGITEPSIVNCVKLCKLYGCKLDDLIF